MRPTFQQTVDVLVKAYLNDTLNALDCAACAVANLISHQLNAKPVYKRGVHITAPVFISQSGERFCVPWEGYDAVLDIDLALPKTNVNKLIGYSNKDIARIEIAFLRGVGKSNIDNFNGLMAVVDVLAEIHGIDLTAKEEAKLLFVKA